jgi:hypothetical protein
MRALASGLGPAEGHDGSPLASAWRQSLKGLELVGGWRAAYVGFRSDLKARQETHRFPRWYQCTKMCDMCFAEKASKYGQEAMLYTNFSATAPHLLTSWSHEDYVRHTALLSPWVVMPGFRLENTFYDTMHTIWLGTAKVMLASMLGLWSRLGCLGDSPLDQSLRAFSLEMKKKCKEEKIPDASQLAFAIFALVPFSMKPRNPIGPKLHDATKDSFAHGGVHPGEHRSG